MMRLNAIKRYDSIALSAQEVSANLSWLKLVAMAAMLLDHIAIAYLQLRPNDALEALLRMPGRISIPAFAFLIAYGYEKFSSDRVNYALRLWLFALISEPAYIAFFDKSGNALIPLALGATILLLEDRVRGRFEHLDAILCMGDTRGIHCSDHGARLDVSPRNQGCQVRGGMGSSNHAHHADVQ